MSMHRETLPDVSLDWLSCIECVERVQVRDAAGWVAVEWSAAEGDPWDGQVWKCPECATPSEEWEAEQQWQRAMAAAEAVED